jgi:hypothetical protein
MMKKLLFIISMIGFGVMNAQTLQTEDFNSLTIGNVGTSFTGNLAGQNDWKTLATNGAAPTTTTNAGNANFQITANGNSSNGFVIEGANGNKGNRFMWKDGLQTLWGSRNLENDIIEVEVDINPGMISQSRNDIGVIFYNEDSTKRLAGFTVNASTFDLLLYVYSTPTSQPAGNYFYNPKVKLTENTWSKIVLSFNIVTGRASLKAPGIPAEGFSIVGNSAGTIPTEVDFIAFSGNSTTNPNTSSASMTFDNFVIRATKETTLGENSFDIANNDINVHPNPAKDHINIDAKGIEVTSVVIRDLNGRTVKEVKNSVEVISISELSAGIYTLTVNSENSKKVKKIIVQ